MSEKVTIVLVKPGHWESWRFCVAHGTTHGTTWLPWQQITNSTVELTFDSHPGVPTIMVDENPQGSA